jgi:excinuclease ABC subunit A
VDRTQELSNGGFAPTDWSQRGVVRIEGADKENPIRFPFFHATTSGEWVVVLRFFVPRGTFNAKALGSQLKLVPFYESPTPVLSDAPRLKVTDVPGSQEIAITAYSAVDFETPAFDAFLTRAVAAFLGRKASGRLRKASEL